MKIAKGHYVPKEFITSEALHEAVVKCFVAAGFSDERPHFGKVGNISEGDDGLGIWNGNGRPTIMWGIKGDSVDEPLTLQQLFTAENGLQWPDWAVDIRTDDHCVWFDGVGRADVISGDWSPVKSRVLAIRQPKEREVKTIEDAVIAHNGAWLDEKYEFIITTRPNWTGTNKDLEGKFIFVDSHNSPDDGDTEYSLRDGCWMIVCHKDQFKAEAKRLGYINGYRWGVEYPTNGDKPNLGSDVWLSVKEINATDSDHPRQVLFVKWHAVQSFMITDPRHKPADTSYLNAPTQSQSLTHSAEGLTHSEWWDYENDKALNCPPVGAEVEIIEDCYAPLSEFGQTFLGQKCVVMSSFKNKHNFDIISVEKPDGECCCFVLRLIRPLDHATRKAELERKELIKRVKDALPDDAPMIGDWNTITWVIERLVDTDVIRK